MKIEVATRLHDALMACREIQEMTESVSEDEFLVDRKTKLSVWKLLEIIGEALRQAEQIDPVSVYEIPNLRDIIDTRNRITHGYDSVSFPIIWRIARVEIPNLQVTLAELMQDAPDITPGSWAGA